MEEEKKYETAMTMTLELGTNGQHCRLTYGSNQGGPTEVYEGPDPIALLAGFRAKLTGIIQHLQKRELDRDSENWMMQQIGNLLGAMVIAGDRDSIKDFLGKLDLASSRPES